MKKGLYLFIIFSILSYRVFSQNIEKIDSLVNILEIEINDTIKVDILTELCWELRNSEPELSIEYGIEAKNLATQINYQDGLIKATSLLGVAYRNTGDYRSSLTLYYQALEYSKTFNNKTELGYTYINFGNLYNTLEYYSDAQNYLYKAKEIAKELNNSRMLAYAYFNIGRYFIANLDFDSARIYTNKALDLRIEENDIEGQAACYKLIGDTYNEENDFDNSLKYYFKSKEILDFNVDKDLVADLYNEIGLLYFNKNEIDTALKYCTISLQNALEISSKLRLRDVYETLTKIYVNKSQIDSAFKYQSLVMTFNESLINQELSQKITYEQFQAEKERNKAEIKSIQQQNEINKLEIKRQRTFIILMGVIIVIVFVLVFVFIYLNSKNKKISRLLKIKNHEITEKKKIVDEQNEEILLKNEELNAQNDEIIKQRDEIYEQKRQITDSIIYASRIQEAILYNTQSLSDLFKEAFIFFRPRDVVSGDFYWYRKFEEKIIVVAADCTGHGVPGAFMSLLGVAALEEIVFSKNIFYPKEILERMRNYIKTSLKQSMKINDSQDGMDMVICTVEPKNKKLYFSGANNPLFLIKDNELTVYEGNFNPVGIDLVEKPFEQIDIDYQGNEIIYMFSDGIIDQFNTKRERFKTHRFKKLLLEINQKKLSEQKDIIETTIINWKGSFKQIDDILVMAIKL